MKILTILLALVFTVMFSSTSIAEWKKVTEIVNGSTIYVDVERIRKHGGYVYYWSLVDFLIPEKGWMSVKLYKQADCKIFRSLFLQSISHRENMGNGASQSYNPKNAEWNYPSPNSVNETILKSVCLYVK